MDREALINEFKIFLGEFLKERDLDFVDLIYRYEGKDLYLRVLTDKFNGGINKDEFARLNRELGNILDEKNFLESRYILEVSSPGLDRLLKTENDFKRALNKRVRFFLNDYINGKLEWEGVVSKVEGELVSVDTGNGLIEVPLVKINKAKREI
jgi:ribosome maturation factor RimP